MSGKGGEFERSICKSLSIWLKGEPKPYQYWRMPGSGSLATIHEENVNLSGDIRAITTDAKFLTNFFSIECKTGYPKTSFFQLFHNKNFNIQKFWEQCVGDAKKGDKSPMLIYRKKGKKPLIGLEQITALYSIEVCMKLARLPHITLSFAEKLPNLVLFDYACYMSIVTPDKMKRIIEVYNE